MASLVPSTRGGATFEDLAALKVNPSYAFNIFKESNNELKDLSTAVAAISGWLKETIAEIEFQSEMRVSRFYLGKTYVHRKKNAGFNKEDPSTWRKDGISSRWGTHKGEEYGKSGMVVLTIITKDRVPENVPPAFRHQQDYALAVEQGLIMHFAYAEKDQRLANETLHPGHRDVVGAIGYPLYMAYKLEDFN